MNLRDIPIEAHTAAFLPTRYFGSKRRQITWLASELKDIRGSTAIDPFGGTGTVSAALSALGFSVTYCDIFRFNEISARAIFRKAPLSISRHIDFLNGVQPHQSFISDKFSGIYFTNPENEWLDGFAKSMSEANSTLLDRDALYYCVFQACLKKRPYNLFHRANLGLRMSEVSKSFGNWYTWRKSFFEHAAQALRELAQFRKCHSGKVRILQSRSATKHKGYYDLIYLDPPYFKINRKVDSYLQRYHFLEGLCNYATWPTLLDSTSAIGMISKDKFPNEWGCASDLLYGIETLLSQLDSRSVALSYVSGQSPSMDALHDAISRTFKKVTIKSHATSTALSKNTRTELLIIGEGRK